MTLYQYQIPVGHLLNCTLPAHFFMGFYTQDTLLHV